MKNQSQSNYKVLRDLPDVEIVSTQSSDDSSISSSMNSDNQKKQMIKEDKTELPSKSQPMLKEFLFTTPMSIFKDFDDTNVVKRADPIKVIEKNSGEIDIMYSMSKSSKAIDDLIDFQLPIMPKMNRPRFVPEREIMDPLDYAKMNLPQEPKPLVVIPEFTPSKILADLEESHKTFDDKFTMKLRPPSFEVGFDDISPPAKRKMLKPDIQIIIEEPTEIEALHEEKQSQFMELCENHAWGVVEQNLRSYNNENPFPNFKHKETGETPLMLACKDDRLVTVTRLLDMGVDVNESSKDGQTALHYAAKYSSEDILKLLLVRKGDANIFENTNKCLSLHFACGRVSCAQPIVSHLIKATTNAVLQLDREGAIPLMYAIEARSIVTMRELLKSDIKSQINARKKFSGDSAVHIACRKKNIEALRLLVELEAPINTQNVSGQTPLHISAQENDDAILNYLYTNKANAKILDNMHRSALYLAAERGNTKVVEFLIDKFKCNVLTRDKDGNTLMHVTSLSGHPETTMSFLTRGVPLHMPNKNGSVCLHAAAEKGHINVVCALIDKGSKLNARTKDLYTPLHVAVRCGNLGVVEALLGYGAEVNVKGGVLDESPLHIAASMKNGGKCAEMLLKSGANVNDSMKNGETPLHVGARTGNLETFKALLDDGANPIAVCNDGNSALHIAARYCHFPIVKELISFVHRTQSKMDATILINLPNNEGETALHLAAELEKKRIHMEFEDTDIMKLLLEYDGDMKLQTKFTSETPLHYCASAGNSDILLEIVNHLDAKIQYAVNKQAKNGWSPLLFASERGHHNIAGILLNNNARVDIFDEHGMTALHLASEMGHDLVTEVLLAHKAFVNAKSKAGLTPLHMAAQNGFKDLVETLINKYDATIDALTLNKKTPLHLAAQNGKKEVCKALLNDKIFPADPAAVDAKGQTPLHLAAKNDHSDVVRLFLRFKPELLIKACYNGMTCGHIAAAHGSLAVVKEFMKFNKSIIHGLKNKSTGSTALHLAAEGGHTKLVKVLLNAGGNPCEENNDGMACLHLAAKYGHIELLNCLKTKMSLKIVSNKTGMTPLHIAAHYGQIEFFREMLVEVPADIKSERPKTGEQMKDVLTESGLTALHLSAQSGHENLVRLLLNCGVDVFAATTNTGTIPLHFAAQNGHLNVTSLLLGKSSLQVDKADFKGRTALHLAASHGHLEMAALFIGQGGDNNIKDNMGFTPLHYAAKSGYLSVCKLLVESGSLCEAQTKDFRTPLTFAAHFNHTAVVSFLLRNEHSTDKLLEDHKFLFDLMICSKLNHFKSLKEFILLSPAPAETAAKLASEYEELSESEKERSKDLLKISEHCEEICVDLVALAAIEGGADKLLTSLDNHGVPFLDILIECNQKEVIAHPSIQRYLSDVWMGNLNWPTWKFFILYFVFFFLPISWMSALLPFGKKLFKVPVIKFVVYIISHVYLTSLFMFLAIFDAAPYLRTTSFPTFPEWLLWICLSGHLVAELINPVDRKSFALLKIPILFLGFSAIIIQLYSALGSMVSLSTPMAELFYIRNQFLAMTTWLCLVYFMDFLSIHHLFGPWTIIIRQLVKCMFKFVVFLVIFLFAFACMFAATYEATVRPADNSTTTTAVMIKMTTLYMALFGQAFPIDLPNFDQTPSYALTLTRVVFGVDIMITVIVLMNFLIAILANTYEEIDDESDIEWKYGRAKLIRNMRNTTPIPSPFILLSHFIFHLIKLHNKIRNKPMPQYTDDFDAETDQILRRKSIMFSNFPEGKNLLKNGPEQIEDVVNWPQLVKRYLSIRNEEL